jgi:hypothetical protein
MKYFWSKVVTVLIAWIIALAVIPGVNLTKITPVKAQGPEPAGQGVSAGEPVTPGVSPPVRSLPQAEPRQPGQPVVEVNPRRPGGYVPNVELPGRASVVQSRVQATLKTPAVITSFDGIDLVSGGSGEPPDTVGDVGPNHYVQMVNSSFAIFDKNGTKLTGPTNINALWSDGTLCQTRNEGDPIVLYDRLADRWMLSQFNQTDQSTPPFYQCIAVSQTADPTGVYYTYSFVVSSDPNAFNDYPKFGVWPDGYYMGANEAGFTAYVFDRQNMLAGAAATFQKFNSPLSNFMLPSDLDGPTAPPAGTPNYFYTMGTGNMMELWALHVDWTTPANSSFAKVTNLASAVGFGYDVCPADPANKDSSLDCIPQRGTAQKLDAIGEWPMFRFQYRNHGSHESLVGNFTADMDATGSDHAGIHWFELRRVGGGSWSIFNEGNYAPDANERWMGSAAMDKNGNIAVGYSVSNGTDLFPSIRYATRLATDPAGQLGPEVILHAGNDSQTSSNRWGDYSAMTVDPTDDCTFWFTSEYIQNSADGWRTRVGTFKIPSCGTTFTNKTYLPLILK